MNGFHSGIKLMITIPVALILTAYLIWEWYWYTQAGLVFVKWHTHLMVFVYIGLFIYLTYRLFGKNLSDRARKVFLVISSVTLSLFISEGFLALTGLFKTFTEKASGIYISPYTSPEKNYYHIWSGESHYLSSDEFSHRRPTNSLGFADTEWSVDTTHGGKRILALGDSFTEGQGAPFDSSYVYIMKQELAEMGDSFYIMNAGVCGSDPFINFINLKDRLIKYKPDYIIQSIGTNDMSADILFRGGMERFQKDSTIRYRPAPWWEPIYAISYLSRVILRNAGYDYLLGRKPNLKAEKARIDKSTIELFKNYSSLCQKNRIRLIVVLHPEKEELKNMKYNYDFTPLFDSLAQDPQIVVVDLLPSYKEYIEKRHTDPASYYWKKDGHHNSKGYQMMAETTLQSIAPFLHETITNNK